MTDKKLTVLIASANYVGHLMSSVGMAEVLRDFGGHRCVFAVTAEWKSQIESIGFEVKLIGPPMTTGVGDSAESNVMKTLTTGALNNIPAIDKEISSLNFFMQLFFDEEVTTEPYLKTIIVDLKPDVIITDHVVTLPSIVTSGIPWIFCWSSSPLSLDRCYLDERLPPSVLGLPTNGDPNEWQKYRQQINEGKQKLWQKYRDRLIANGCPALDESWFQMITPSPFANVYMYPKELDYTDIRPLPDNFHQFDYFKRSGSHDSFELPETLANRSGKLIYFSLGSMASGNVNLMIRLLSILAKSEHRFIVSKGVMHDKYSLADNMWGARTVPQIRVLPIVDAVITHGGNNTVTETMYFGKPMIVLPLFFDQYDNAQRVQEKGFGVRLNPYECSESDLLKAIDFVLNDKLMAQRVAKASQRIQSEKSIEKFNDLVKSLVK